MVEHTQGDLENLSSIVFNLHIISQSVVHAIVHCPVGILAGLFPDDAAIVSGLSGSHELHVLDDEGTSIASDGTNLFAFLHAHDHTDDVGFNTEIAQHT